MRQPSYKSSKKLKEEENCAYLLFPKIRSKRCLALYSSDLLWTFGSFTSSELLMPECISSQVVVLRQTPLLLKHTGICSQSISWSPRGIPFKMNFPTLFQLTNNLLSKCLWCFSCQTLLSSGAAGFVQALISDSRQNLLDIWRAWKQLLHSNKTATFILYLWLGK